MDINDILKKWDETRQKIEILEERLKRYKSDISKEMNKREQDKIKTEKYCVSRRRNTRSYLTKDSVPEDIWKKYSTKCSYDSFILKKL